MASKGIAKVIWIHPQGNMNILKWWTDDGSVAKNNAIFKKSFLVDL